MGTAELDGLAWVGATLDRIAELEVELGEHTAGRRGSGCRVTSGAVLTAARVVAGASAIQVRLNPGTPDEWATPGTVAFADDDADVAVVSIAPRQPGERVAAALFGRINTQADGIRCAVGGFPAGIVEGRIPALSSWRNGTLDLEVSPPSEVPGGTRSPWAGIAGAAVWCRGHIVGVVSDHDRGNGLAAGRGDHWFEQVPPAQLASLRKLVGLPDAASQLTDVTDLGDAEAALDPAGLAAALAPLDLLDRGAELADLADFCAGNTAYQWWRADPWAGKTALAAWLVLHPPAGMTPVAFFAGCHEPGRARSEAFTEALIRQFAAIVGEPPDLVAPAAVHTQYRRLLAEATRVLAATGRRLLLVVDGLDEDDGGPPTDPRSIASRLPQHPSDGMRILVTSRWRPGVPGDVPRGHPLRTCTVRELSPSPHARHLTVRARRELAQALVDGDQLRADVLGLIAAAGGRLTPRDLVELTGADRDRLAALLDGAFGRTLATHPAEGSSHPAGPAFGFAHDALRETAEAEVSALRPRYVERLDRWADSYRERGWPASTPR
jgi:hypothetical protein